MENIFNLIIHLPELIIFFYPGYITIYLYYYFLDKYYRDSEWVIIRCVFISFIFTIIAYNFPKAQDNIIILNIYLLILGVVIGIVSAKIKDSKWFEKLLKAIQKNGTYQLDEFELIRDRDRSAWICVYIKNTNLVYEGSLTDVGTRMKNKYICLTGYRKYLLDKEQHPQKPYIEDYVNNNEEKVIIYYDDIFMFEKRELEKDQTDEKVEGEQA